VPSSLPELAFSSGYIPFEDGSTETSSESESRDVSAKSFPVVETVS
jgi:hypothetical protein